MKNGKRTRRALIRLRHTLQREKFLRWHSAAGPYKPHRVWAQDWHEWHALGCP